MTGVVEAPDATRDRSPAAIGAPLLAWLCERTGAPRLEFAAGPEPLGAGNATFMYRFSLVGAPDEWTGPLVLRVFRTRVAPRKAKLEAAVQRAAVSLGARAPRVLLELDDAELFGAPGFVMQGLPGRSPMQGLGTAQNVRLPWFAIHALRSAHEIPVLLAGTLRALHAIPAEPVARRLEAEGFDAGELGVEALLDTVEERAKPVGGFEAALAWARARRPRRPEASVLCHGDHHPHNLLFEGGALRGVVDWSDARLAEPAFDVGNALFLLEFAPLALPRVIAPLAEALQRRAGARLLAAYCAAHPVDVTAVRYYAALRCLKELIGVARDRLRRTGALEREVAPVERNPWDFPRSIARMGVLLCAATGSEVRMPDPAD